MRANFRMQRLYVGDDIVAARPIGVDAGQQNYLQNVLRLEQDAEILIFNGRDGEWRARLDYPSRKKILLVPTEPTRAQPEASDLVYLFSPLKVGRMDYLIQKAVEMGAGVLQPVLTQHVQGKLGSTDKIRAQAIEAAEQCGILAIPAVREPMRLTALLESWAGERRIIFCDEGAETNNPLAILQSIGRQSLALLVGPEGGFSDEERKLLHGLDFVTAIPLGPRILRADTAAVAALAVIQASIGDWR